MKPVILREEHFNSDEELLKKVVEDSAYDMTWSVNRDYVGRAHFYSLTYNQEVEHLKDLSPFSQFKECAEVIENSIGKNWEYHAFACSHLITDNRKYFSESFYINKHYDCAYRLRTEYYITDMVTGIVEPKSILGKVQTETKKISFREMASYYDTFKLIIDALKIRY